MLVLYMHVMFVFPHVFNTNRQPPERDRNAVKSAHRSPRFNHIIALFTWGIKHSHHFWFLPSISTSSLYFSPALSLCFCTCSQWCETHSSFPRCASQYSSCWARCLYYFRSTEREERWLLRLNLLGVIQSLRWKLKSPHMNLKRGVSKAPGTHTKVFPVVRIQLLSGWRWAKSPNKINPSCITQVW